MTCPKHIADSIAALNIAGLIYIENGAQEAMLDVWTEALKDCQPGDVWAAVRHEIANHQGTSLRVLPSRIRTLALRIEDDRISHGRKQLGSQARQGPDPETETIFQQTLDQALALGATPNQAHTHATKTATRPAITASHGRHLANYPGNPNDTTPAKAYWLANGKLLQPRPDTRKHEVTNAD